MPRRSSRLCHPNPRTSSAASSSSSPPPHPPSKPRSSPNKHIVVTPVPTTRASRALKRRRLSEQSEELHNEYESPRSIKRTKTRVTLNSQRRPSPAPLSAPVVHFGSLSSLSASQPVRNTDSPKPPSTSPAIQPVSYSRFPRRGRSPLSSSSVTAQSSQNTSTPSLLLPLSPSHLTCLSSARPRKRRNLYLENHGRIGDVWKYCCIERVEIQFAKYGYSNIIAAERQLVNNAVDRTNFRISTPSTYDDVEMSYDDDEDEEDDLDDIDQEIWKTIEEDFNDHDDDMLDIDAEGEVDPDHIPIIDLPPHTPDGLPIPHDPTPFPPFLSQTPVPSSRYPPLPLPFPRLDSISVPGIGNAMSDDVQIGPIEAKLSRGRRSRHIVSVKGKQIIEWKPEDRGEPMGRGTPVDDHKRNDWLHMGHTWWLDPSSPIISPLTILDRALDKSNDHVVPTVSGQDWTSFLDSLARIINMRATSTDSSLSFPATLGDVNIPDFPFDTSGMALPASLASLLDSPDFQQLDHLLSGQLTLPPSDSLGFGVSISNVANTIVPVVVPAAAAAASPAPGYTSSSSTLSRALG